MASAIPIIRLHGVLLVTIQVELSDRLVRELRADLGREIQQGDVRGVVLELSGVDTFDTYIARSIRDIAQIARLMGVRTIVTGLDPGIAVTLVEMGMHLEGVPTTLDLESALAMLTARPRAAGSGRAASEVERDADLLLGEQGPEEDLFDGGELEG